MTSVGPQTGGIEQLEAAATQLQRDILTDTGGLLEQIQVELFTLDLTKTRDGNYRFIKHA